MPLFRRFKLLRVKSESKLLYFRLSPRRLFDKSKLIKAFIVGQTSVTGMSLRRLSEKSKWLTDIGSKKIRFNWLPLTLMILWKVETCEKLGLKTGNLQNLLTTRQSRQTSPRYLIKIVVAQIQLQQGGKWSKGGRFNLVQGVMGEIQNSQTEQGLKDSVVNFG